MKRLTFEQKIERGIYPSRRVMYDYYITTNHTAKETSTYFDISAGTLQAILVHYSITKSKELTNKRVEETNLKKYGVKRPLQSVEIQKKWKNTNLQKYGCDFGLQNQEVRNKIVNTSYERYGQKCFGSFKTTLDDKTYSLLHDRELFKQFLLNNGGELKTVSQVATECGVGLAYIYSQIHELKLWEYVNHSKSRYEDEIYLLFKEWGIVMSSNRTIIAPFEIDLYSEELKLGIEFNGTYWHSSLCKDKDYHLKKSKMAEEQGIRLIHIYEYEWVDPIMKDKIVQLLRIACGLVKNRIYARECKVRKISNKEAKILSDKVHMQGHRNALVTYGLYYKEELVQLMSFSHNKKYQWEIIRGCPGSNNIVVGGVSKLFSHFVKDYDPQEIFSYCDFNKFDGKSYESLGMKLIGYTGPDKTWVIDGQGVKRNPTKYKALKKQAECIVWGSGSKKYLWIK